MTLDLYVDLQSQTLIKSHRNGGAFVVPRHYRSQQVPLRVFYVTPNVTGGAANPYTIEDSSGYTSVRVAIGGFNNPLAVANGFSYNLDEDCWEDSYLDLDTVELLAAVDAASSGEITSIFETEAVSATPSLIKTQNSVVVRRSVLTSGSGLPTPVTDTLFADQLEIALGDSDTLTWRRVDDQMIGDVPLFGAPAILASLTVGYPSPAVPGGALSVDTDSTVVGGRAGERYLLRVRFAGIFDEHNYVAGYRKPGDDAHLERDGGIVSPTVADLWYIEVSSPAQRIYLNKGTQTPPTTFDYFFRFVADAGATVTLTFAADNSGDAGNYHGTITLESASQVSGVDHAQPYDVELVALAGLTSAADRLPYFTGSGTAALATFTAFARTLLDDADAAAVRTTLGLGTMALAAAADYLPLAGGTMTGNLLSSSHVQAGILRSNTLNSFDNGYSAFVIDPGDGRLRLYGNGANVVYLTSSKMEQRNGATSQTIESFHTYTDASNYQGARLSHSASALTLAAITAGTGADDIDVVLAPAGAGLVVLPGGTLLKTAAALTDGAAAAVATLLNAPVAGDPTKWIPINDNGTTRHIPAW